MIDISKNEGCVWSVFPIIIFQHPWGSYFFFEAQGEKTEPLLWLRSDYW